MTTRQLLRILHKYRELQIADPNRWPQFLFGKDLEKMSEVEARRLVEHLEVCSASAPHMSNPVSNRL